MGRMASFFRMMKRLREETGEQELSAHFESANTLHINFYEDWLDEDQVRAKSDDVRAFINRIAQL